MPVPYGNLLLGKPSFTDRFGRGGFLASDMILFTDLRDSSGPLPTPPHGRLVPKRFTIPVMDGEYALHPDIYVATWDGNGYDISNFSTNTARFALGVLVGGYEAAEDDAFALLYMVEVVEADAGGAYSVGSVYALPKNSVFFLSDRHVYLASAPLPQDPFAPLPVLEM